MTLARLTLPQKRNQSSRCHRLGLIALFRAHPGAVRIHLGGGHQGRGGDAVAQAQIADGVVDDTGLLQRCADDAALLIRLSDMRHTAGGIDQRALEFGRSPLGVADQI